MAQTIYKVDCSTAGDPIKGGDFLLVQYKSGTVVSIPIKYAKSFYSVIISHDSTLPSSSSTSCIVQVKTGDNTEALFEFPMNRRGKAYNWFDIMHGILSPMTSSLNSLGL